jgi:hypothetical protein
MERTYWTDSQYVIHLEDDLVQKAIAWQFPPQGDDACDDLDDIHSCATACEIFECQPSPGDVLSNVQSMDAVSFSPDTPPHEGNPQKMNVPFLSLMLPDWVHEKAVEDEVAGVFRCMSLASFASSPASSTRNSPTNSCLNSPEALSKVDVVPKPKEVKVRCRSGVSWADLAESEDDGNFEYPWCTTSTASTATSSPDLHYSNAPKNVDSEHVVFQCLEQEEVGEMPEADAAMQHASSDAIEVQDFFVIGSNWPEPSLANSCIKDRASLHDAGQPLESVTAKGLRCHQAGISWVELVESDRDPLNYIWSVAEDSRDCQNVLADLGETSLDHSAVETMERRGSLRHSK